MIGTAGVDPLQQPDRRDGAGSGASDRRWRRWSRLRRTPCHAVIGPTCRSRRNARRVETVIILGFAVLFAYLFLVALYESWTIPRRSCCRSPSAWSDRSSRSRS